GGRVPRLGGGGEAMLVTAGARARVVVPWTADHARMQDRLETLEPLDTPTELAPAVELALGAATGRPDATVALFTDLPREASGLAPEELAQVNYVQVGRTDDNVAIAGLTVDQPPFSTTGEATVTATVRNYSHLARHVARVASVGEHFWTRRDVPLEPRAAQEILLDDPPAAGEVVVTLETGDALAVDDEAVTYIAPGEQLDLLLVTESRELAADFGAVTAAMPRAHLEVRAPARYEAAPPGGPRPAPFRSYRAEGPSRHHQRALCRSASRQRPLRGLPSGGGRQRRRLGSRSPGAARSRPARGARGRACQRARTARLGRAHRH